MVVVVASPAFALVNLDIEGRIHQHQLLLVLPVPSFVGVGVASFHRQDHVVAVDCTPLSHLQYYTPVVKGEHIRIVDVAGIPDNREVVAAAVDAAVRHYELPPFQIMPPPQMFVVDQIPLVQVHMTCHHHHYGLQQLHRQLEPDVQDIDIRRQQQVQIAVQGAWDAIQPDHQMVAVLPRIAFGVEEGEDEHHTLLDFGGCRDSYYLYHCVHHHRHRRRRMQPVGEMILHDHLLHRLVVVVLPTTLFLFVNDSVVVCGTFSAIVDIDGAKKMIIALFKK
jgi:hypothetical protein